MTITFDVVADTPEELWEMIELYKPHGSHISIVSFNDSPEAPCAEVTLSGDEEDLRALMRTPFYFVEGGDFDILID